MTPSSKARDYLIFLGVFLSNLCVAIESFGVAVSANIFQGVFAVDNTWISWLVPSYLFGLMTAALFSKDISCLSDPKKRYCFALLASASMSFMYFYRMNFIPFCMLRYLLGVFGGIILSHSSELLTHIPSENFPKFVRTFTHHVYEVCLGLSAILGGVLSQYFQWRFIFFIEIILYFISLICLYNFLTPINKTESKSSKPKFVSVFVLLVFFLSIYIYLSQLKEQWNTLGFWSNFSWVFLIASGFLAYVFYKTACKKDPFFDFTLLKNPYSMLGVFGSCALRIMSFGPLIFLSKLMIDVYQFQYSSMGMVIGTFGLGLLFWGVLSHALFHSSFDPKKLILLAVLALAGSCFMTRYLTILSEPIFIVLLILMYSLGISFLLHSPVVFNHSSIAPDSKEKIKFLSQVATLFSSVQVASILKIVLVFRYTYHFLIFSEQAGQVRSKFFYLNKAYEAFSHRQPIPGLYASQENAKIYLADQIHKQAILAGFSDFCFLLGLLFLFCFSVFIFWFLRYKQHKTEDQFYSIEDIPQ